MYAGLRMPSPSGSETSRREAFSEGHGDSEAPVKVERRAAGTERGRPPARSCATEEQAKP